MLKLQIWPNLELTVAMKILLEFHIFAHRGINIFGAMTFRFISVSDQMTKYSSEKRPFGIKTFRNKNRSE